MPTDTDVREVPALEPCPFCGGGGLIRSYDDTWFASCDACYCTVGENYDRAAMPAHLFETEEAAVAAWNRRATRETAKAEARRPRYRHIKRGSTYEVVGSAELQCTGPIEEGRILTIYQGEDGKWWARPAAEFGDGRFERISEALPAAIRKLAEG